MNANVKRPQRDQPAVADDDDEAVQPMTKAEKRAAVKAAKAKAEAASRRRQAVASALAALAVVGIVVTAFVLARESGGDDDTASAPASEAPGGNTPGAFPPLPPGADAALGKKPSATAGTGELTKLTVEPLIEGKGPATAAGQAVTVNYVLVSYRTGEELDASWTRSQPFTFQLGAGGVIPGWDQGLVGVKVGSRVQLDIPSNLAYGDNPGGGRPSGPLRFIVDVLAAQ